MDRAQKHIYIAVNEYLAQDVYRKGTAWPVLQNKLKEGRSPIFLDPVACAL